MVISVVNEKPSEQISFPIIKQSLKSGLIVLFTDTTEGVVIKSNGEYIVGHYKDCWTDIYDSEQWASFDGEITLKNEK